MNPQLLSVCSSFASGHDITEAQEKRLLEFFSATILTRKGMLPAKLISERGKQIELYGDFGVSCYEVKAACNKEEKDDTTENTEACGHYQCEGECYDVVAGIYTRKNVIIEDRINRPNRASVLPHYEKKATGTRGTEPWQKKRLI